MSRPYKSSLSNGVEENMDIDNRVKYRKNQYKQALVLLQQVLEGELEWIDDENFVVSGSVDAAAHRIIQELNQLKSLIDLKHR